MFKEDHSMHNERPAFVVQITIVGFLVLGLCSCGSSGPHTEKFILPSGRTVDVLGMTKVYFNDAPVLMVKYQTKLSIKDIASLKAEADDIWSVLRIDAENGNFHVAVVSASEAPHGLIVKKSSGYNFVYKRQADGSWLCGDQH